MSKQPADLDEADRAKLNQLVELTEDAAELAETIGRPVARASYHLEAARLEAEAAAGNPQQVVPRRTGRGSP